MADAQPLTKPSSTLSTRSQTNTAASVSATGASTTEQPSPSKCESRPGSGSRSDAFVLMNYPVSANRYWRSFKGRVVVSAEAMQYKSHVGTLWRAMAFPVHEGPVFVELLLHPKTTKAGAESKTRMDLDNCIKVAIDALKGIAFADDKQVRKLEAAISDPVEDGGLSVRVRAL